ncbi:hypothetical protein [Brevundimonas vesicularis]
MRRLLTVLAITAVAAPLLAGCIIISTDRPTTRVVHTTPAEAN